jgi:DNA repair protein RecN (Recombination protein N)
MLLNLSAKNFILIDQLSLDLSSGLHVITGETGAGKSILLDAILFCFGYKFDVDVLRSGAESCVVSVEAMAPPLLKEFLSENGVDCDDTVIVKRQQFLGGRKKFFINDQAVTQKLLEQVAGHLLEIHGQNTHSSLLDPASHMRIVDSYGELHEARNLVGEEFKLWQALRRELEEIKTQRHLMDREIDYLEFIVAELLELNPQVGEEEELADLRSRLQNQERDTKAISDILSSLTEPDLQIQIASAQKTIYRQIKDDSFADILQNLDQASIYISEAVSSLEAKLRQVEQGDLEAIEERLFAIRAMARKHNITANELPQFLEDSDVKLRSLTGKIEQQSSLESDILKAETKYHNLAKELSSKRKKVAQMLEDRVGQELAPLKMAGAVLKVEFVDRSLDDAAANGIDIVRFIASNNPGTPLAPIDKIASGGELSRFMLAMKVALFDKFTKPTIIFDEVDTGIGGLVADAVGLRMKLLSEAAQVITITHQPQVAGKADRHVLVSKKQHENHTLSHARMLSDEERLEEIARMISGSSITDVARKAAKELIG